MCGPGALWWQCVAAAAVILSSGAHVSAPASSAPAGLATLLEMGYSQAQAQRALDRTGGNFEAAVSHLLDTEEPAASTAPAAQGSAVPEARGSSACEEESECAICCETLHLNDAAMRCAGHGGTYHYGHAACLAKWVQQCRGTGATPTCPMCRCPLQLNRRRLQDFMQRPQQGCSSSRGSCQDRMSQEDREVLHSMMGQGRTDSDSWEEIDFGRIAGFALLTAGVVAAGFLIKHLMDGKDRRSNRRS